MAQMRALTARDIVAPVVVPVKATLCAAVLTADMLDAAWKRSGDASYVLGEAAKTTTDGVVVGAGVLVGAVRGAAKSLGIDLAMTGEQAVEYGENLFKAK